MSGQRVDFRVNVETALGIVRGMFTSQRTGITILNAVRIEPMPSQDLTTIRELSGVLGRAREFLIKSNALLSMIMAQDQNILQAARTGNVEGGGIKDVEERIKRIRALREAIAEVVNVLQARTIVSPQAYRKLRSLVDLAERARLGQPLIVAGETTYVL